MEVHKVIIHEIIKESGRNQVQAFLTDATLVVNAETIDLVEKLDNSFKRDIITYALFRGEEGDNFPNYFDRYTNSNLANDDFIAFTRLASLNMKQIIKSVTFAKGGYFVFADYTANGSHFLGVYLIRDEKGILFNKDSDNKSFSINQVSYLNTNKLAMGCRINFNKYAAGDGKYIALIKNNLSDISEYFINWISIQQPESSTEYTTNLFEMISSADLPINQTTGMAYELEEYRKKVYEYIIGRPNKNVNICQLSSYFYGSEDYLTDFAEINNIEIDTEFKADGRALRKFYRLDVKADGILLRFSRGDLNIKVKISEDDPNRIIIDSPTFANKLRHEARDL